MNTAQKRQAVYLVEACLAVGLATFSIYAGTDPLQATATGMAQTAAVKPIIDALGTIGVDWGSSLIQEAYRNLAKAAITPPDAKTQPLAHALADSLAQVIKQLSTDWQQSPRYDHLRKANPQEAEGTIELLALIADHASEYLQKVFDPDNTAESWVKKTAGDQDPRALHALANKLIAGKLSTYAPEFQEYVNERLPNLSVTWTKEFLIVLRDPETGTAAWRAYQDLRMNSQDAAIADMMGRLDQVVRSQAAIKQSAELLCEIREQFRAQVEYAKAKPPSERDSLELVAAKLEAIDASIDQLRAEQQAGLADSAAFHARTGAQLNRMEDALSSFSAESHQYTLDEVREYPTRVFDKVALSRFTGRTWLINEIDAFLAAYDCGYFAIEGEAGTGKSTLAAWLVQQRGYIYCFGESLQGPNALNAALRSLSAQLIERYQVEPYFSRRLLPFRVHDPHTFQDILRGAAQNRSAGSRIVLVLDALDTMWPALQPLLSPSLPKGVYVIATYRPGKAYLAADHLSTRVRIVKLDPSDPRNLADLQSYLEQAADSPKISAALHKDGIDKAQFADSLASKSQGIWIYVRHVTQEIEFGTRKAIDLEGLPDGLTQYYLDQIRNWRGALPSSSWSQVYLPVLSTLAACRGAATLNEIVSYSQAATSQESLRQLLEKEFRPFLTISERVDSATGSRDSEYKYDHESLPDFFHGRANTTDWSAADQTQLAELERATQEAHYRIAEHYLREWRSSRLQEYSLEQTDTRYLLLHLTYHLAQANMLGDLKDLLKTPDWVTTRYQVDASGFSYANDILQLVTALEDQALTHLPEIVAWNLVYATIASVASLLSPALLETIFWCYSPALAYRLATLIAEPQRRAQSFVKIGHAFLHMEELGYARHCFSFAADAALDNHNLVNRNELLTEVIEAHIAVGSYRPIAAIVETGITYPSAIAQICERLRAQLASNTHDLDEDSTIGDCLWTVIARLSDMGAGFEHTCQRVMTFHLQDRQAECQQAITTLLQMLPQQEQKARIEAIARLAPILANRADRLQAQSLLTAGVNEAKTLHTVSQQLMGLAQLVCAYHQTGDLAAARQLLTETMKLAEGLPSEPILGTERCDVMLALAHAATCIDEPGCVPDLLPLAHPQVFNDEFTLVFYEQSRQTVDAITSAAVALHSPAGLEQMLIYAREATDLNYRTALLASLATATSELGEQLGAEELWELAEKPIGEQHYGLFVRLLIHMRADKLTKSVEAARRRALRRSKMEIASALATALARQGSIDQAMQYFQFALPANSTIQVGIEDVAWRVAVAYYLCKLRQLSVAKAIAGAALDLLVEFRTHQNQEPIGLHDEYRQLLSKLFHVLQLTFGFDEARARFLTLAAKDSYYQDEVQDAVVDYVLQSGKRSLIDWLAQYKPPQAAFLLGAALTSQKCGDSAKALSLADRLVGQFEQYDESDRLLAKRRLIALAGFYADLGEYDKALHVAELAAPSSPGSAATQTRALTAVASAQARAGRYDLALATALGQAQELDPSSVNEWLVDNPFGCEPLAAVAKILVERNQVDYINRLEAILPHIVKNDGTPANGQAEIRWAIAEAYAERGELDKARVLAGVQQADHLPDRLALAALHHAVGIRQYQAAAAYLDGIEYLHNEIAGAMHIIKELPPQQRGLRQILVERTCTACLVGYQSRQGFKDIVAEVADLLATVADVDESIMRTWTVRILAVARKRGKQNYLATASVLVPLIARLANLEEVWQEFRAIEELWDSTM